MDWFIEWTAWNWLILGLVLLLIEVLVPGVFLLWWGLAGLACAGISYLIPNIPSTLLAIVYAICSFIFSFLWWKYQHRKDQVEDKSSSLNQRDHAMLDAVGVVETLLQNDIGRGKFGDTTWRIRGENLNLGDRVKVQSVQGITLNVIKLMD